MPKMEGNTGLIQRRLLEELAVPMLNPVKHMPGMLLSATSNTAYWMAYTIQALPRPTTIADAACSIPRISLISGYSL
jgi:hypothetical protein